MAKNITRDTHNLQVSVVKDDDGRWSIQFKRKGRALFTSCNRYRRAAKARRTLSNFIASITDNEVTVI